MCGIVGIYHLDGQVVSKAVLQRATEVIAHRGPDDEGYVFVNTRDGVFGTAGGRDTPDAVRASKYPYSPGAEIDSFDTRAGGFNLAFGHRRLSIVDLSPAGHQPMCNADGTIWIVYNGEIYNYIELREELKALGHRFVTRTDTEVIIAAYEEWGYDCLQRFNGMWAFAIWDVRKRELFCSRDRFGVKPFYYYWDGASFAFASEIKSLLQCPGIPRMANDASVCDYLVWGFLPYHDDTFFDGIKQLSPAHYLVLASDSRLEAKRWFSLDYSRELALPSDKSIEDTVEQFRWLLKDAVRLRLRSDVPIGTCLSGGLDSSSIVCLVNQFVRGEGALPPSIVGERQETFSSCYEDESVDERRFIEEVLRETKAERNFVFATAEQLWEDLPELAWHQDEPFGGSSIYAQWAVMRMVNKAGVKVLLDGQGGDELLAGYHPYYGTYMVNLALKCQLPRLLHEARRSSGLIGAGNLEYLVFRTVGMSLYGKLPMVFQYGMRDALDRFRGIHIRRALNPTISDDFLRHGIDKFRKFSSTVTDLQRRLYNDVATSLTWLLRYEDRNSMAFSVEARVPFLDYRLVEYVFSLPASVKIRDGWTKWILREAMQGVLPEEVRVRKDKLGFPTPQKAWLWHNHDRLRGMFCEGDVLSQKYLNVRFIQQNLDKLLSSESTAQGMWQFLNLELWLRRMFS